MEKIKKKEEEVVVAHKLDIREEIYSYAKIVLICCSIALFIRFVTPLIIVDGSSMNNTLYDGELVIGFTLIKPTHGSIITFKNDQSLGKVYIKRVIGCPGDTVKIEDHQVYINGEKLDESKYAYFSEVGGHPQLYDDMEITLGKKEYFVCGDNRYNSRDSRIIGPIKKKDIRSVVFLTLDIRWLTGPVKEMLGIPSTTE
ncbi:MAG: signal peptidase I [Lachnospiraceae bacterium]|nr:signal peptidase I [Lachnospiraceae bacterium]